MQSLFTFTTPPHQCNYLPAEASRMRYELVAAISAEEYEQRLREGWRHFGHSLFRPECAECRACQSIRVLVDRFRPNRSQRRAWEANRDVEISVGLPSVTDEKLDLYDRFHAHQTLQKGWPENSPKEGASYVESFVDNPVPTMEWLFHVQGKLIGVGYVDHLPQSLSAIYFFHDPEERRRSLGTFNVLKIIAEAKARRLPFVYLGYYVVGCGSLEYKANFAPNEVLAANGEWIAL